jgi:DivIVA domain-containing protein
MVTPGNADIEARKDFPLSFRGFDQAEVRAHLAQLTAELGGLREREATLRARVAELESAPAADLDEAALEIALGREATRVLHAAREAAAEIRANAEEQAAALIAEADAMLAKSSMEAEEATATIRAEVDEALATLREDTEKRSTALLEEARTNAAAITVDANAERERMRSDLDALTAARSRLIDSFETVRRALDAAFGEVARADAEATAVTASVLVEKTTARPDDSSTRSEPAPELVPEAVLAPEPERAPEPAERHSAGVRLLRPAGGTPVAPPVNDALEGIRLVAPVEEPTPEPELEPEPEPEPEPAPIVAAEPEPEPEEEPPPVEDLFARLRADRATKVASATAVLAATTEPATSSTELEPPPVPARVEEADELEPDLEVLAARDVAVGDSERGLVRSLKRSLADEQNEVLDALRRLKGRPTIEGLLPEAAVHDARFDAVLHGAATSSAAAGGRAADGAAVATEIGRSIAADLRTRVDRAIEDAGGDLETLAEGVSAAYREWKSSRVEPLARDVITAGYAAGTYGAASGELRWIVDPAEGGCPDCDDNVLAGPTPKGTAFPTGQLHPPAHAGCRCLAIPANP